MKKIITFLLCLCMLTACGGNNYDELINLLDEGKYTEAVDYINQLAYEEAKNNGTIDSKNIHINYFFGSWEYAGSNSDITTYDLVINDNKTCTIDGTQYLWEIRNEYDTYLEIDILEGATKAYRFDLSYDQNTQFYSGYLAEYNPDTDGYNSLGNYRNRDHYEIIALTTDNWLDYFELASYSTFHKDAFGDISSCSYTEYYKLKDEYANRLNNNSNYSKVAYEFNYENGKLVVNYDLATETFEVKGFEINETHPQGTSKGTMSSFGYNTDDYYYGFNILSGSSPSTLSDGKQVIYNYRNNPVMTRIQGELMLWKGLE